ncbi:hypothetical protein [Erwinia amylovora]|uniref:Uncharacterized protein n=4 Tax=Erwinia amylovora TaxID=552 RepID=A0A831EL68_ERWAM|nr:hypothetical protein [Erwinia amylovora]CBX82004.1 hypothetical protein predicted by Glimmer/Critica [Erwinia amylovora ATCC BAA-2158]CCP04393.1 hypothetical protein BN439_3367 [Erwinia amylovora Ea644]CCP08460.1 hypothetical protein BN440_3464 [Erwinia amylovora MR1]CDK16452.1 hypothetical protein LA635_2828 [Erwinia amylovora LA635]CDK19819.1 hypothetical protein LA636_2827 [Erwinia amylovora LA636]CDK23190.1 hypothetical protein LA637_2830 [Erwinia amylovora LA637]
MPKQDNKFVNTSKQQHYELEDWLYRNNFSKKHDNVDEVRKIINTKIKKGVTSHNIKWAELDGALETNPEWFALLVAPGK